MPYQSGAPALNALLGGHVDVVTGPIVEIFPQVQQGKLRALAVTGPKRARVLPEVPTLREVGACWDRGLRLERHSCAGENPAGDRAQGQYRGQCGGGYARPSSSGMRTLGYEPYSLPLAEAPAFLKNSIDAWARMIREAGITGE